MPQHRPATQSRPPTREWSQQKAKRLHVLARHFTSEGLEGRELPAVREGLLGLSGVGPETADSILLYALGMPSFVIDAYTRRLVLRLGMFGGEPCSV